MLSEICECGHHEDEHDPDDGCVDWDCQCEFYEWDGLDEEE